MAHKFTHALAGLAIGSGTFAAAAQEEPDCGTREVTFCADAGMLHALGLCPVAPLDISVDPECDLEAICNGDPGAPECCWVTMTVGPLGGCPDNPDPCPVGLQGLISNLSQSENIPWDDLDPYSAQDEVMEEICEYLHECCQANSHSGEGISYEEAIQSFYYFFPDSEILPGNLRSFFEACGDSSLSSGCPDNPGPPPGPVLPPVWPSGVDPSDGPPIGDEVGSDTSNRGGRCEGIALTGSPSFEQFSNDPAECAGGSSIGLFDIDLYSGKWSKQSVDLALPANGFSWIISRTYNGTQQENVSMDPLNAPDWEFKHSNGIQGYDWRQDSLPELVQNGDDTALYLVMNAQSYVTFGTYDGTNTDLWVAGGSKSGAVLVTDVSSTLDSVDYKIYELYDLEGLKMSFFSPKDTTIEPTIRGQLWKIEDPAGNVAYIGHETDPGAAMSNGFVEVGTGTDRFVVESAYDTSGRLYRYAYSANPIDEFRSTSDAHRLISITVYPEDDDMDPYVAKVEYSYYDYLTWTGTPGTSTTETHGLPGDLKMVKVRTPTGVGAEEVVERTLYRYWQDSDTDGYDHAIKYIYGPEGIRRADLEIADGDLTTDDVAGETLADMKPYAAQYMEYNDTGSDRRIKTVWGSGECGCGTAATTGTHNLTYQSHNGIVIPGQDDWQPWYTRTMIEFPPATPSEPSATTGSLTKWETHYFGLGGARMATVLTDDDPSSATEAWVTLTEYGSISVGAAQYTPEAISDYDHSTGAFEKATSGLVYRYIPWVADEVGGMTGVDARNFGRTRYVKWETDSTTSDYLTETEQVFSSATITDGTDSVDLGKSFTSFSKRFAGAGGTEPELTSFEYSFHTGVGTSDVESLRLKTLTVNQPGVPTDENGSGTGDYDPVTTYFRLDGTVSWVQEADGVASYTKYDDNVPILTVQDASTAGTGVDSGDLTNAPTTSGSALHIMTEYAYDPQMRMKVMSLPHPRKLYEHYDVLDNGLIVNVSFPLYDDSANKVYGPASFSLSGHNGAAYQSGTIAVSSSGLSTTSPSGWVDQADVDAFDAFDSMGALARLSVSVYDEPGDKIIASRAYYDLDGTMGNQYDETTYAYDDMGRMVRMEAPHGTVTRTTFDGIGRPVAQWMGTDDTDFPSGSGTSDNMTLIASTIYDGGTVGNGLVSKATRYVDDDVLTDDDRKTDYLYDARNRLIVQLNPLAPHSVYEYDNLDRLTHTAMYKASTGLDEDTAASTEVSNRVSLSETMYDARGRVYESRTYEIVQSTGAKAGGSDYLFSRTWYSDVGQVIKTSGRSLTKATYDRLRRPIAMYSLSSTNDSAYADADDVTGDTVVSESHTLWDDDSGLAMAAIRIDRHPEDTTTTGPLFNPLPTTSVWDEEDIAGRVQISAMWYDEQDRIIESVDYGTKGFTAGSSTESFDRLDSAYDDPPIPTDLVGASLEDGHFVIKEYNGDGEVEVVVVPNDETGDMSPDWIVKTKSVFDDAGRLTQRIENWDGVSATPALPDVNRVTEIEYEDGLMIKQLAKNARTGLSVETQATRYLYGTTKGSSQSDVATGHLLVSVYYPDATEEDGDILSGHTADAMFYEYNAQGQRKYTKDQAGNEIEMDFDDRGRTLVRRVKTVATGFDNTVRRIATTYDDRGLVESVKQYNAVSSGTMLDAVDFTYDDWGNLLISAQDPDNTSALSVTYAYVASSGEISTLRRTSVTYPSGAQASYDYDTGLDADLSRVTAVQFKPTSGSSLADVAGYTYGGAGNLLNTEVYAGSTYHMSYYDTTDPDGYAYLDNFSRPTKSYWSHTNATSGLKFYDVDLYYDVASNIREINDQVTGRNTDLGVDDFRRLTSSEVDTDGMGSWDRDQEVFGYDHLGNWQSSSYDALNGGSVDLIDDRIFNRVNEMTDRDLQILGAGAVARDPVYDDVGNMTDDGRYYEYTYDAFGRITQVDDDTGTVAEYRYNGLFQRTVTTTDRDGDSDTAGEHDYHHVYDDRWRVIAIYRKDGTRDAHPKELTVYHAAGMGGSSSPLDSVIARYRSDDEDGSTYDPYVDWGFAADGDMDKRLTYFQNWRGDVVFVSGSSFTERIDYSPYGVPSGFVSSDQNYDGSVSPADSSAWIASYNAGNAWADTNFDGTLSGADNSAWIATYNSTGGTSGGRGVLSPWADNHIGYAGYRLTDQTLTVVWHVRFREFVPELGVWTRRDPIGYHDGYDLYEYVRSNPVMGIDPRGLAQCHSGCGGGSDSNRGGGGSISRSAIYIPELQDQRTKSPSRQGEPFEIHPCWTMPPSLACKTRLVRYCKLKYGPSIDAASGDCTTAQLKFIPAIDLLTVGNCRGYALQATNDLGLCGDANAGRHCILSACLAKNLSRDFVLELLELRECCTLLQKGTDRDSRNREYEDSLADWSANNRGIRCIESMKKDGSPVDINSILTCCGCNGDLIII